jgi:hypothetical protein
LGVAPALFRSVSSLTLIVVRYVVEHEATTVPVLEHAAFTTHAFGHENAAHARWPDHASRVELHELHVDELGTGAISE